MKKQMILGAAMLTIGLFMLASCQQQAEKEQTVTTTTTTEEQESNVIDATTVSRFEGTIQDEVTKNPVNDTGLVTYRIYLTDIKAIEASDDMADMFASNGLVLNIEEEQLRAPVATPLELQVGDRMTFEISGVPMVNMSIPPQLAGQSLRIIEKID